MLVRVACGSFNISVCLLGNLAAVVRVSMLLCTFCILVTLVAAHAPMVSAWLRICSAAAGFAKFHVEGHLRGSSDPYPAAEEVHGAGTIYADIHSLIAHPHSMHMNFARCMQLLRRLLRIALCAAAHPTKPVARITKQSAHVGHARSSSAAGCHAHPDNQICVCQKLLVQYSKNNCAHADLNFCGCLAFWHQSMLLRYLLPNMSTFGLCCNFSPHIQNA